MQVVIPLLVGKNRVYFVQGVQQAGIVNQKFGEGYGYPFALIVKRRSRKPHRLIKNLENFGLFFCLYSKTDYQ
jgi:hypothetical protein